MNRVIGTVETRQSSALEGDHHIITTVDLADGINGVPEGCLLYVDGGKYKALAKTDSASTPVAVALEAVEGTTAKSVVNAAVHGALRADKLVYADGSPAKAEAAEKLRKAGIYALGRFLA